jgi:hypothetical protein
MCEVGIIISSIYNISEGILACMVTYMIFFQLGLGPQTFVHTFETCHPSALGVVNMVLFIFILLTSIASVAMAESIGIAKSFIVWGTFTFFATLYLQFFLKDTTFKDMKTSILLDQKSYSLIDNKTKAQNRIKLLLSH